MKNRRLIAMLSLLFAVGSVVFYFCKREYGNGIPEVPFEDVAQEALKMKQEQSKSGFQLAVVLLGTVWATLLAKKDENTFEFQDWPPTVTFSVGNLMLLASVYNHLDYMETASNQMWKNSTEKIEGFPDIVNSFLNNPYFAQNTFLFAGLVCTALHLMLVFKFQPRPADSTRSKP
jgi:hypothetical protein